MKKITLSLMLLLLVFIIPTGCNKDEPVIGFPGKNPGGKFTPPDFLSTAQVPLSWFKLAVRLVRTTPGHTGSVAIRINALDYLLKPIDREELIQAVAKVSSRLNGTSVNQLKNLLQNDFGSKSSLKRIALPTLDGLQMEEIDTIISCSSDGNYTHFLLKKNRKLVVSRSIKDIEELLTDYSFLRVHNSFLVNLN
jgi:DNA-binding LytR/AlgR family response regulator